MKKIIHSKLTKQILVLCLLLVTIFSSITKVNAVDFYKVAFLFGDRNYVWRSVTNDPSKVGDPDDAPIANTSTSTPYNKVGLDILLGTSRDMVTYTGEIPAQGA